MILKTNHIVINESSCTIYASKFRRICALIGCCVIGACFVCVQCHWIFPTIKELPTSLWVYIYILLFIGICWSLKDIVHPPKPIVLTKKGVLFPTGRFERWENVISIYLVIVVREQISMPISSIKKNVSVKIPISMDIVRGEVPSYYGYGTR